MKHENRQRGAIIVEATLALPFFMFAIFTLLSVVQICYTQARVTVALDSATKQMAEYAHIYFVLGLDETFEGKDGKSSELANEVGKFLSADLGDAVKSYNDEAGQFVTDAGNAVQGDSITAIIQNIVGEQVGEQMMKNNLKDGPNDTAEAFMKRNRIINLNMDGTKFLEAGEGSTGKDVFITVNYDIKVIQLLNLDYTFHLSHCAYAQAWAD